MASRKSGPPATKLVTTLLIAILGCMPQSLPADSTIRQKSVNAVSRYEGVVKILFQYEPFNYRQLEYRFVLRFLPSLSLPPESQIIITKDQYGHLRVQVYRLGDQSKMMWRQIDDIMDKTGKEEPEAIAKLIKVEIKEVQIPSVVLDNLLRQYSKLRFSPHLETGVVGKGIRRVDFDLTTYDLGYETWADNNLHVSLGGEDYGHDQQEHPVIRWMNQVRKVVEDAQTTR